MSVERLAKTTGQYIKAYGQKPNVIEVTKFILVSLGKQTAVHTTGIRQKAYVQKPVSPPDSKAKRKNEFCNLRNFWCNDSRSIVSVTDFSWGEKEI